MAGTYLFNSFCKGILDSTPAAWDLDNGGDTFKVMLTTSSYTPAKTHNFRDDVDNEVIGTGYTAGGATLGTLAVTQDDTNNGGKFDCADVTWGSSTITARYAIIYKVVGTAATDPLVGIFNFGSDKISNSGDFKLQWHTDGVINIDATET